MNLLTETDLQASRANLQLPVHTAVFKMDNQQGPPAQHREVCSMLHGSLDGRGVWGRMDTCICMTGSLHCSCETVTTWLIGYSPIQNESLIIRRSQCEGFITEAGCV